MNYPVSTLGWLGTITGILTLAFVIFSPILASFFICVPKWLSAKVIPRVDSAVGKLDTPEWLDSAASKLSDILLYDLGGPSLLTCVVFSIAWLCIMLGYCIACVFAVLGWYVDCCVTVVTRACPYTPEWERDYCKRRHRTLGQWFTRITSDFNLRS